MDRGAADSKLFELVAPATVAAAVGEGAVKVPDPPKSGEKLWRVFHESKARSIELCKPVISDGRRILSTRILSHKLGLPKIDPSSRFSLSAHGQVKQAT